MSYIPRNSRILILALVSFLVVILVFSFNLQKKQDVLKRFGLIDFKIVENTESNMAGALSTRLTASNGTVIVKVEHAKHVNVVQARQHMDEKRFSIESLYQSVPSPYPDVITRTIECPDKFRPIINRTEENNQDSLSYVLYATDRFTYGACSDDTIKYRAVFYLVYCKEKNEIYQMELFTEPEKFTDGLADMLQSFKC